MGNAPSSNFRGYLHEENDHLACMRTALTAVASSVLAYMVATGWLEETFHKWRELSS